MSLQEVRNINFMHSPSVYTHKDEMFQGWVRLFGDLHENACLPLGVACGLHLPSSKLHLWSFIMCPSVKVTAECFEYPAMTGARHRFAHGSSHCGHHLLLVGVESSGQ